MHAEVPSRWQRPIFVASMGRSGSTLLQRILNVHPAITIWGEHGGFLSGVLASHRMASQPDAARNLADGYEHRHLVVGELGDKSVFKPWVSPFVADDFEASIRAMLIDLFARELEPSMRWGFKEIRYTDLELRTLMQIFPEAHLVVLARDIAGYAQSRFFAFGNTDFDLDGEAGSEKAAQRLTNMMQGWTKRYTGLVALSEEFGDRSTLVAYNDLTSGSSRPMRLFQELGEALPRESAVEAVLNAVSGSSYRHNSAARAGRDRLRELIDAVEVDRDEVGRISDLFGLA